MHEADGEARATSAAASISQASARRHERQHHVDAHVLAAAQQPRRGEQRDEIERVFGDFVGPGECRCASVLRSTMSAVTMTTIASSISAATTASASSRRPKACERRVMSRTIRVIPRRDRSASPESDSPCMESASESGSRASRARNDERSIPRQLPQLGAVLRRALDHRLPGHVVGLREELLAVRGAELDRLDAGLGLACRARP